MIINVNAILIGTITGVITSLAAYKFSTRLGGKSDDCYVIRSADLTLAATNNMRSICDAVRIGQADVQPGKITVTKHYQILDGVHSSPELTVEAILSYNDTENDSLCKRLYENKKEKGRRLT